MSLDTHAAVRRSARRAWSQMHKHLLITMTALPRSCQVVRPEGSRCSSPRRFQQKTQTMKTWCVSVWLNTGPLGLVTLPHSILLVYSSLNQDESAAELDSLWSLHSIDRAPPLGPRLGSTFTHSYCCSCQRTPRASLDNHADKMDICRKQTIF